MKKVISLLFILGLCNGWVYGQGVYDRSHPSLHLYWIAVHTSAEQPHCWL